MQNDNNLARAIIDQCDIVDEKWVAAVLIYAARHMKPRRLDVGCALPALGRRRPARTGPQALCPHWSASAPRCLHWGAGALPAPGAQAPLRVPCNAGRRAAAPPTSALPLQLPVAAGV
jgi:hypothetical protein